MRILIADDDPTSRMMLRSMLEKFGHEGLEASDGEEAWAMLREPNAPLLAILDWMMPGMDGIEVLRHARAELDTAPYLIMLTSRTAKTDVIEGLEAGADDYLVKPFDPGELKARVDVGCRMLDIRARLAAKIQELQEALEKIEILQGIIPICMYCKKIRDDAGYWDQVEAYISRHSEAKFSHGICPECLEQHCKEFMDARRDRALTSEDPGNV